MKLISMTQFVLEQDLTIIENRFKIKNYANFLNQPLKLEMFVTCDEDGNVLEEPGLIPSFGLGKYRKAKEKVLFDNVKSYSDMYHQTKRIFWEVENIRIATKFIYSNKKEDLKFNLMNNFLIIEDLVVCEFTLTPNAIKKFNL